MAKEKAPPKKTKEEKDAEAFIKQTTKASQERIEWLTQSLKPPTSEPQSKEPRVGPGQGVVRP